MADPLTQRNNAKSELRAALLAARRSCCNTLNDDAALAQRIYAVLMERVPQCIAFYWPMAGEFDLRMTVARWLRESPTRSATLPVVMDAYKPLIFHRWAPETELKKGRFQIPVPISTIEAVPNLLLIPCVGFDKARYRLGYGGGYYDRTLANLSPRPFTVGVAYEGSRVDVLPRDSYDIPLDLIVSECRRY